MSGSRLHGKRVFITGAAQGIGFAIARACHREGAALYLCDIDGARLDTVGAELGGRSGKLDWGVADISDAEAIRGQVARATDTIGTVNALVNNAGVNVFAAPLEMTDEQWKRCFDINLNGAWNCSRALLPDMVEAGEGVILNIVSTHSFTIIPGTFPYPVAKHALLGLTKSLALEFAPQGVRVNAIAPGYVATQNVIDYWNSAPDAQAAKQRTLDLHPGGRIAQPEEIANAAVFMVSDECPFMNATCLTIDGGLSVLHHPA
ncbi:SDR family oxidoreductase [Celeribacter sp.]|uniref:SDR family oxidoreductase n=1 Tax=Celeribacter sp. TaxID=1890673 RepID=UPI003A94524A